MKDKEINPIEKLNQQIENLSQELSDDIQIQSKLICYQHKKILLHFLESMRAMTISETKDRFNYIKKSYEGFNTALMEAQNMGERMEKGLQKKNEIIKKLKIAQNEV